MEDMQIMDLVYDFHILRWHYTIMHKITNWSSPVESLFTTQEINKIKIKNQLTYDFFQVFSLQNHKMLHVENYPNETIHVLLINHIIHEIHKMYYHYQQIFPS